MQTEPNLYIFTWATIGSSLISLFIGLITGALSGYIVSRYFEFRTVILRATYSLRLFARDNDAAKNTLDELQLARDQLISQGFASAEAPFNTLIEWALKHMNDNTVEVEDKKTEMMPLLEGLRPSFHEVLRFR